MNNIFFLNKIMALNMPQQIHFQLILSLKIIVLMTTIFTVGPPTILASELISPTPYQREIQLTGLTRAKQEITIGSEVSGKCIAVHANVGEKIAQSGDFAQIDDTFIRLDLKTNKFEQNKIKRQLVTERKTLSRYSKLKEKQAATQAKLDEVSLSADLHEISLQNLDNNQIRLNETLKRHVITAPVGWYVLKRTIEPGEFVQRGRSVAELGDFNQLVIPLALSFSELQSIKQVKILTVKLPDLDMIVPASIFQVSPTFDPKTRKIPIELIIDSTHPELLEPIRGGIRAELSITVQDENSAFTIPLSAVIDRYDTHWVVTENNQRLKVLFLGTVDGDTAIITTPELTQDKKIYKTIPPEF